ncbi:hypothetical protein J5N97_006236 [Dioscorea zingiberensis]|uniref:Uncharacterized protein n=1 Tax=Dioscorea zingiberensis TaxID=325984 RepID=A0A9D5DBV7_9LILI|nr:hypothetical protein J5N97_006236 [Dioscorea zingiberensis]
MSVNPAPPSFHGAGSISDKDAVAAPGNPFISCSASGFHRVCAASAALRNWRSILSPGSDPGPRPTTSSSSTSPPSVSSARSSRTAVLCASSFTFPMRRILGFVIKVGELHLDASPGGHAAEEVDLSYATEKHDDQTIFSLDMEREFCNLKEGFEGR